MKEGKFDGRHSSIAADQIMLAVEHLVKAVDALNEAYLVVETVFGGERTKDERLVSREIQTHIWRLANDVVAPYTLDLEALARSIAQPSDVFRIRKQSNDIFTNSRQRIGEIKKQIDAIQSIT